jgi:hypothetical protein
MVSPARQRRCDLDGLRGRQISCGPAALFCNRPDGLHLTADVRADLGSLLMAVLRAVFWMGIFIVVVVWATDFSAYNPHCQPFGGGC